MQGCLQSMASLWNAGHMHRVRIAHGLQGVAKGRALRDLGHDYGERMMRDDTCYRTWT